MYAWWCFLCWSFEGLPSKRALVTVRMRVEKNKVPYPHSDEDYHSAVETLTTNTTCFKLKNFQLIIFVEHESLKTTK